MYKDSINYTKIKATLLISQENDAIGYSHYKWQQTIGGVPIENAIVIQHIKNGKLSSQYGYWIQDTSKFTTKTNTISASDAISKSIKYVAATVYRWQVPAEEKLLKQRSKDSSATYYPKPILVYYSGEGTIEPANLRLAYKMDIFALTPFSRQIIFIDAINGSVLGTRQLIRLNDAIATAQTAYSGSQTITTDMFNTNQYRLKEAGRGNGIQTLNLSGKGNVFSSATDFVNASTSWNLSGNDKYATDAHWGEEKTYDFYKTTFNRNSIDNSGFALTGYVHADLTSFNLPNNINAFWDGSEMVYGDGGVSNGTTVTPLTALDITGHEITHGLTQHTANLSYNKESGALDESFSDIMGTSIEFYGKPASANWTIGENIGITLRSMSNPKTYAQPDTYGGINWYDVNSCTPSQYNDYCGVHTNSGVSNKWFYLLSQGGSGTNDLGNAYNVTGIGISEAEAIAYRTLTLHLTPTSNFADCRTQSITSATELYGASSKEVNSVKNAWYAVGIGDSGFSISGPPYICSSSSYFVTALPPNSTVSWSIPSNVGPVLQLSPNTPSTNQLTITNQGWYGVSTVLTATVTLGGTLLTTLTLPISNDNSTVIYAPYVQDACLCYNVAHPSQSGTASTNTATFIHMCCDIRVTLNLPPNKTVALGPGPVVPTYWFYSDGILYFALPIGSGGIPFRFNIVPTTNDGSCSSSILFFAYSDNGNAYTYAIAPNPVSNVLTVVVNDNTSVDGQPSAVLISDKNKIVNKQDFQFTVKVYDIANNKLLLTQKSNRGEMTGNFNVETLRPGNYFAQITDVNGTRSIKFLKN